ncbi:MAG: PAS domain S-box protein [Chloroflexi bacterium]|nr:PAS domain S-box protein [Chloroflexota bacterium]
MNNIDSPAAPGLGDLRSQVEKIVALRPEELQNVPPAEFRNLLSNMLVQVLDIEAQLEKLRKTQAELEEASKQFTQLYDFAPVGYFNLDSEGVILHANITGCDMLGVSRSKLVNMPFLGLVEPQYHEKFRSYLRDIAQTGYRLSTEVEMCCHDGSIFHAQLQTVALYERSNLVYRVSVADITERKRTEQALAQSEKRLRTTLDSMLEGCIILDFNWRYVYANDAASRLGHRTRQERLGRTLMEVFPGIEAQDTFAHLKRCMEERVPDYYETEFTFPEGEKGWFEVRAEPVPEGMLVLYEEITQRKQAEQRLQRGVERFEHIYRVAQTTKMQPAGLLTIEHKLIERVMALLVQERERMEQKDGLAREFIEYIVDFFLTYTDKTHQSKEGQILLKGLTGKKLSPEHREIMAEIGQEHDRARILVTDLARASERWKSGDEDALKDIIVAVDELVKLYQGHIEKEDRFFVPSMEYLSGQEQDDMLLEFWEFDRQLIHEKYARGVEALEKQMKAGDGSSAPDMPAPAERSPLINPPPADIM